MKNYNHRAQQSLTFPDMVPASPELKNLLSDLQKAAQEEQETEEVYQDSAMYQNRGGAVLKNFRLPPELAERFEKLCKDNRRNFSNAMRRLIAKALERGEI